MSSINYAETRVQRVQVPVQVPVLKPIYVEVPYPVYVPVPGPNRWPMALQDPHLSQQIMQQTPLDQQYDLIWVPDEEEPQYQKPIPRQQIQRRQFQRTHYPKDQAAQTEPIEYSQPALNQTLLNQTQQTQQFPQSSQQYPQSQRPSRPYRIFDEPANSTQQPQIINRSEYMKNSQKPIIYNKEPTVTDPHEIQSRVGLPNDIAQSQFVNSAAFLRPSTTKN